MANELEEKLPALLHRLKQGPQFREPWLPVLQQGRTIAWLEPVTWLDADNQASIALFANWREQAAFAFPSQFPVTLAGTQRWVQSQLLEVPDRFLFWVTGTDGARLGHVGLFHFNFELRHVELDNIVRGVHDRLPGLMLASVQALLHWAYTALEQETTYLRVFSDNNRAIRLYEQCGFQEISRVPVMREQEGDLVRWIETDADPNQTVGRALVTMRLPRSRWLAAKDKSDVAA